MKRENEFGRQSYSIFSIEQLFLYKRVSKFPPHPMPLQINKR
jgi:hypothetical protein